MDGQEDTRSNLRIYTVLTLMCLLTILVIVGNVIVICAITFHRNLRKAQYMFLVSLAGADLLLGVAIMPLHILYYRYGHSVFGFTTCVLWLSSDIFFCSASILNLAAIALDRYLTIQKPFLYMKHRTIKNIGLVIGVTWFISILIPIPNLVMSKDVLLEKGAFESCTVNKVKWYSLYSSSLSFFIPLILIVFVYVKCFIIIRKSLKQQTGCTIGNTISGSDSSTGQVTLLGIKSIPQTEGVPEGHSLETKTICTSVHSNTKRHNSPAMKERKAAMMLGTVTMTFVVCWLPFFVYYPTSSFIDCGSSCLAVEPYLTWLGYVNCCLNPIIYAFFTRDLKKTIKYFTTNVCRLCYRNSEWV